MKAIQSKRRLEKGAITRAYTFVQNPPEELEADLIEARIIRLESAWKELQSLTADLYDFEDQESFIDPEADLSDYEEKYLHCISLLKRWLKSVSNQVETPEPRFDVFSRLAEQHSTLLQRLDAPSNSRNDDLPKIRIEQFAGDYKEWPSFRDLFVSAIDSKPNLSNVRKFQYLKFLLKDEAANLIKHIQMSEDSYATAWDRLKERFDRPRHIVTSYIDTFMGLPALKEENVSTLRKIADTSNEVVRGLEAIGQNERDHWLIHILQGKIDADSRRKWVERSRDETKPTIAQFLDFLDKRCEELELGAKVGSKPANTKRNVSTTHVATNSSQNCVDCGSDAHGIHKCDNFLSLTVEQRRSFVKKKNLCFNCLRKGHSANKCTSQHKCRSCQRFHHTLLHFGPIDQRQKPDLPQHTQHCKIAYQAQGSRPVSLNTVVDQYDSTTFKGKNLLHILPTALVNVQNCNGQFVTCRLLLDTASELSYITEDCIGRLGLNRYRSKISLTGISSVKAESTHGHSFLHMKSRNTQHTLNARVHILGRITSLLPRSTITNFDSNRFNNIHLADTSFYRSNTIDILLGADYVWDVFTPEKLLDDKGNTIAVSSIFGWVVTSVVSLIPHQSSTSSLLTVADIDKSLQSFWEIEEKYTHDPQDNEAVVVEQHFESTHSRHADGRYIVELPFKEQNPCFNNTYQGALSRFKSTERRLSRNPTLRDEYIKFMREYLSLGHMRELSTAEISVTEGRLFYLPHHPVVGRKLRVVFDGSFRDVDNNSLNDKLHIGPPIQRNLFAVCFRFRLHKVVFSADIIKMFRQIWVAQEHRNFQRILWRENPNDVLRHYQLCTVTYGTSPAPYLSVRVLQQLAQDYKQSHPIAAKILLEDFYVDDVLTGASTTAELLKKQAELIDLLSQAGLALDKWVSNCNDICPRWGGEHTLFGEDEAATAKVLGIYWSPDEDIIQYRIHLEDCPTPTKRKLISEVARIFDPLGLVSPVIVKFKILFQELWLLNLQWDEALPTELCKDYLKYRADLRNLSKLKFPRYVPNSASAIELHGFCDASLKAYAAVVYGRTQDAFGNIVVNIMASKTRVAPLKQISLPRLELCGALLLTRLMKSIVSSLSHDRIITYAWCDSTVVLSWLSTQPVKLKTFVGNRTSEILETLPRNVWRHVSTKQNPADCASRGIMADQLLELEMWWSGPAFLRSQQQLESFEESPSAVEQSSIASEMKPTKVVSNLATTVKSDFENQHALESTLTNVSQWYRLIRIAAYVKRFINLYIHKIKIPSRGLTFDEIKSGEVMCLKMAQQKFFAEGKASNNDGRIANVSLLKLSPFIDECGLLRVGGRLSNSELSTEVQHPIILPKDHIVTRLILQEEHQKNLHPGVSALFVIVRQKYWVIGARNLIRKITHKCLKCFRQAKRVTEQRMADLPKVRVTQAFPFQNTGCDYAGPFTLKLHRGRNPKTSKGYICLFVCMVTTSIHLELVTDLTTDAFLAALRRFMARRGKCSTIYSDNGTTFVGENANSMKCTSNCNPKSTMQ